MTIQMTCTALYPNLQHVHATVRINWVISTGMATLVKTYRTRARERLESGLKTRQYLQGKVSKNLTVSMLRIDKPVDEVLAFGSDDNNLNINSDPDPEWERGKSNEMEF